MFPYGGGMMGGGMMSPFGFGARPMVMVDPAQRMRTMHDAQMHITDTNRHRADDHDPTQMVVDNPTGAGGKLEESAYTREEMAYLEQQYAAQYSQKHPWNWAYVLIALTTGGLIGLTVTTFAWPCDEPLSEVSPPPPPDGGSGNIMPSPPAPPSPNFFCKNTQGDSQARERYTYGLLIGGPLIACASAARLNSSR